MYTKLIVQALMGHDSRLEGAYRRLTLQELREDYLEGEPAVTINETKYTLQQELDKELEKRNGKIEELRTQLEQERKKRKHLKQELKQELVDPDLVQEIIKEEVQKQLKKNRRVTYSFFFL